MSMQLFKIRDSKARKTFLKNYFLTTWYFAQEAIASEGHKAEWSPIYHRKNCISLTDSCLCMLKYAETRYFNRQKAHYVDHNTQTHSLESMSHKRQNIRINQTLFNKIINILVWLKIAFAEAYSFRIVELVSTARRLPEQQFIPITLYC